VTERPLPQLSSVGAEEANAEPSPADPLPDDVEPDGSDNQSPAVDNANDSVLSSCSRINYERVLAASICPLPVRSQPVGKRRSTLGATILTSSPYKTALEERLVKKNKKNIKNPGFQDIQHMSHQEPEKDIECYVRSADRPSQDSVNSKTKKSVLMKKKTKNEKAANNTKTTCGHKPKPTTLSGGVMKKPRPVDDRPLIPRKPIWLTTANKLSCDAESVKTQELTNRSDDTGTRDEEEQANAGMCLQQVQQTPLQLQPSSNLTDMDLNIPPENNCLSSEKELTTNVDSGQSTQQHLEVKTFYGKSSRGRHLKRNDRQYSPPTVKKRKH
jgi:hypothetical protein